MFSHSTLHPVLRPGRRPASLDWGSVTPYRLALWLAVAATAVPVAVLIYSEQTGWSAAERSASLDRAGQLRYRTLEVYLAGQAQPPAGRDAATAWAELAAVRAELAADWPAAVATTDPAWRRLAAEAAAGPVSRAAAEDHLRAADAMTAAQAAAARDRAVVAGRLFWVGVGSLGVTLAAGLLLAVRVRRLAARTADREGHFRTFMDTGPAAAFVKDGSGGLYYTNRVCQERFGLFAGGNQADVLDPAYAPTLLANDRATLAGGRTVVMEECVPEPDGRLTYWLSHKFPLAFADGRRLLGGLAIDITALKRAEAALRASEERLRLVVGAMPVLLHVVGRDGVVQLDEGLGLAGVGRAPGEGVGKRWEEVTEAASGSLDRLRRALAGEEVADTVERAGRWYDVRYLPQRDDLGAVANVVVLASDVTDEQTQLLLIHRQKRELERLTRYDALTGVFNRRALDERLADEVARAARQGEPLGVILGDLDHFKRLNNDLGHAAGDCTLRRVAAALQDVVREIDTVARYGGEEFCVLLPGADADATRTTAERLRAAEIGRAHV